MDLRTVPISMLNIGSAAKNAEQLRSLLSALIEDSLIVRRAQLCYTVATDNEASMAKAADLFTNYTGSVRCVVHTVALVVKDVFSQTNCAWQNYMDFVNDVVTWFNHNTKALQILDKKQLNSGITNDRRRTLKT